MLNDNEIRSYKIIMNGLFAELNKEDQREVTKYRKKLTRQMPKADGEGNEIDPRLKALFAIAFLMEMCSAFEQLGDLESLATLLDGEETTG